VGNLQTADELKFAKSISSDVHRHPKVTSKPHPEPSVR
jgi:hypothetical protein